MKAVVIHQHGGPEVLRYEDAASFYFARKLRPVVPAVLPPPEAARAHEMMERSEHFGKIVLQVA